MPCCYSKKFDAVFIHIPKAGGNAVKQGIFKGAFKESGKMPKEWEEKFAFAIVRNPFERFISAWKMFTVGTTTHNGYKSSLTLREFFDIISGKKNIVNSRVNIKRKIHTCPQTDPSLLLDHADYIGRFENYEAEIKHIFGKLGVTIENVPKTNISKHDHYSTYFENDLQLKQEVEEFYKEDLKTFGYSYEKELKKL